MRTLSQQLHDLRLRINGRSFDTIGEQSLADYMDELCGIVGDLVARHEQLVRDSRHAANTAILLANGIKPD